MRKIHTFPELTRETSNNRSADASAERRFVWISWLVYVIAMIVIATRHEPWRDELQAWRLAIDSATLADLAHNARFEGHPLLWHALLHLVGMMSREWWSVVALNISLAGATAWMILRFAPFARWQRALILAGYYFSYEYSIIARSYGLGLFLAVAACCLWTRPRRRAWQAWATLLLIANTSAYGAIVAGALATAFAVDWMVVADHRPRVSPWLQRATIGVALASLLLVSLLVYQYAGQAKLAFETDGSVVAGLSSWSIGVAFAVPAQAILSIAKIATTGTFLSMGVLRNDTRLALAVADTISVLVFLLALLTCIRRWAAVAMLASGTAALMLFTLIFHTGSQRHHGHFVIIWLLSYWMAESGTSDLPAVRDWLSAHSRVLSAAFVALHLPMLCGAAQLIVADWRYPFSDARHVAQMLSVDSLKNVPVIAAAPPEAMAVAALTEKPIFIAFEGRNATYVSWGYAAPEYRELPTELKRHDIASERAVARALESNCSVLVIAAYERPLAPALVPQGKLVYQTQGFTVFGERIDLWRFRAAARPNCP